MEHERKDIMSTNIKKDSEIGPLVAGTTGVSVGVASWIIMFFVTFSIVNGSLGLGSFFFLLLTIPVCILAGIVTGSIVGGRFIQEDDSF